MKSRSCNVDSNCLDEIIGSILLLNSVLVSALISLSKVGHMKSIPWPVARSQCVARLFSIQVIGIPTVIYSSTVTMM